MRLINFNLFLTKNYLPFLGWTRFVQATHYICTLNIKIMQNKEMVVKGNNKTMPIVMAILASIYGASPIDVVPDVIPVAGWMDDLVILGGAYLGLAQAFAKDMSGTLASILGVAKWLVWILGGIMVAVLAILGISIYNLVK